jgi:hypothetical protein
MGLETFAERNVTLTNYNIDIGLFSGKESKKKANKFRCDQLVQTDFTCTVVSGCVDIVSVSPIHFTIGDKGRLLGPVV